MALVSLLCIRLSLSLSYSQEKRQQLDKKGLANVISLLLKNDPYALTLSKLIFGFLYIEDTDCMSERKTNYFGVILAASARTSKIRVSSRPRSHVSGFQRAANQSGWI